MLLEALALEDSGPAPAEAWLELLSLAARDPELAAELSRFDREVRAELAGVIAEMVARGEAPPQIVPDAEAQALFAFNLGLQTRARLEPEEYSAEVIARKVDAYLDCLGQGAGSAG